MENKNNKKILIISAASLILLALIMVGYYLYSSMQKISNPEIEIVSDKTSTFISISNFSINPSTLTINKGTTVTWTNNDQTTYILIGDNNDILSPQINHGESYSYTFNTTGEFPYHCDVHPNMKGAIIVK